MCGWRGGEVQTVWKGPVVMWDVIFWNQSRNGGCEGTKWDGGCGRVMRYRLYRHAKGLRQTQRSGAVREEEGPASRPLRPALPCPVLPALPA